MNAPGSAAGGVRANGEDWGLAAHALALVPASPAEVTTSALATFVEAPLFALRIGYTAFRMVLDRLVYPFYPVWRRRARLARAAVRGHSLLLWPGVLRKIWAERPSARVQ